MTACLHLRSVTKLISVDQIHVAVAVMMDTPYFKCVSSSVLKSSSYCNTNYYIIHLSP
jgi:hypothetical protein